MAPFVLKFKGNKSFSPLGQINDADTLTKTWKVCTKVASHLEQGQRLENLSWRLWFLQIALVQSDNAKQKREFKKFSKGMSDKLDKDKGRSIHELQAPNFKRTDSTDKVRLRVEEMAHHRENGTVPVSNSRYASDSANYMKGMQYTFAVDPRVKPIATTASSTNNAGEGGRGMMGKMRVRPMHPPPVPVRAQAPKDGDTTMQNAANNAAATSTTNANNASTTATTAPKNEHAMDVSDDHAEQDEGMHDDSHDQAPAQDQEHDAYIDADEGAGHHTPTPQHLLPSHHPSALPYPPPPSTGPSAHALSNALSSSSGQFIPPPPARQTQNIIRFPTIFSSDFGPTSLLCAMPTSSLGEPSFSFESGDSYQSFSSLGQNAQSSITTQGIYGPNGPPGMGYGASQQGGRDPFSSPDMGMAAYNSGIGVGMQNAGTPFNFGVPRPTFEFPIDEILKNELGEGDLSGLGGANGGGAAGGMGQWESNMNMDYGMGGSATNSNNAGGGTGSSNFGGMGNPWGVPPQEISSPTSATGPTSPLSASTGNGSTSPTKRGFVHHALSATAPQRSQGVGATVAYGVINTAQKANSTSPTSVHSTTSGPNKDSNSFEGQPTSPQSTMGSERNGTMPGAYASTGRERSGSVTGGVGSVVPGNVGNTAPGGVKSECANCGATHTPLWRRGLNDELNCNACGLYCKLHKRARPKNLRTSHGDRAGTSWGTKAGEAELAGEPVQCHNCATMATPLWRKDDDGNTLCNACGLYLKLHGTRRPLSMKSDVIRKRSRHETEKRTSVSSIITVMTPTNGPQNSRRNSPTPPPSAGSSSSGPEQFAGPAVGPNAVDGMGFPFGPDFSFTNESDYMSGIGMGLGNDLTSFSSFGSYGLYSEPNGSNTNGMGSGNGLTTPTSPAEIQHIVETTVMAGVENGGGHVAPHAKRRRMTLESSVSGSSLAHTTGGANSAHSSPTGLGQKGQGNSPPYFSLDSNGNNGMSTSSNNNNGSGGHADQNGNASPTRSTFGSASPTQSYYSIPGVTLDFYGHPIHPPMAPLHPPSLIHPQWVDSSLHQFTPTQSSMSHAHSQSQSASRQPSHGRNRSYSSHSRSNSQHITMPLYLYDGGASSRAYEGANANTPTASGTSNGHPTDDELYNSGFDLFGEREDTRVHYGPTAGM